MTGDAARKVLFLTSSTRANGNSVTLARRAAEGLEAPAEWIDLATLDLPEFRDVRPEALSELDPVSAGLAQALMAATDVVFVAPVYWYALPVPAKRLLDHWSNWLSLPELQFWSGMNGRRFWLITTRADPDPEVVQPVEAALVRTARWMGAEWCGGLHGIGDAPGEVLNDAPALSRAADFLRLPQPA